jgi:cell division protein FtsW
MLNMMVAVGLFPVTGQPLPLISKGGTSTLINCAYIGIILSVSRYVEAKKQQEALENSLQMQPTSNEAIITPTGQVEDEYEELSQDA